MSEWFARACSTKKRFPSERRAKEAAKLSQIKFGNPMEAYSCRFCKQWHIGASSPEFGSTARRMREVAE